MLYENDDLASLVADMTGECCVELFAAYGVVLKPCDGQFVNTEDLVFSGAIGFIGADVRGSCLLVGDPAPIVMSSPSGNPRDWTGELTNQLVGRLKRKFLGFGLEVQLTIPVVLSGVHLQPSPKRKLSPRLFGTDTGSVMVWVEVESEPGFALGDQVVDGAGTEGDILIF